MQADPNIDSASMDYHTNVVKFYTEANLLAAQPVALSRAAFLLVAILCGGDYNALGLPGCGAVIAYGLIGYGLGTKLCDAVVQMQGPALSTFLVAWRNKLRLYLTTDPQGYIGRRYPTLSQAVPDTFPSLTVINCYLHPATSKLGNTDGVAQFCLPDITGIAQFCELNFVWSTKGRLSDRFRSNLWPGIVMRMLVNEALQRDGVARDNSFSDLVILEVRTAQQARDIQLRVRPGSIESTIHLAVLSIWGGAGAGSSSDAHGSQAMHALDELTIDSSCTKAVYPIKSRLLSIPTAVLVCAWLQDAARLGTVADEKGKERICRSIRLSYGNSSNAGASSLNAGYNVSHADILCFVADIDMSDAAADSDTVCDTGDMIDLIADNDSNIVDLTVNGDIIDLTVDGNSDIVDLTVNDDSDIVDLTVDDHIIDLTIE
jgi:hypothetical protein